jgi:hypothetical protein
MALKRPNLQRQLNEWRGALAGITSWRVKGAIGVAGMGVVALVILAASKPAEPVAITSAMEPAPEERVFEEPAPKRPRGKKTTPAAVSRASTSPMATDAAAEPTVAATGDEGSAVVTLTGCLEQDDDVFRLKDTEGMSAPKSRNWKSGFLKKKSAKLDVVDASNRLRLKNHVGHRVSITGLLYEREILANSVKRAGTSCN